MNQRPVSASSLLFPAFLALLWTVQAVAGDTKLGKKDVPLTVLKAFEQAYPKATIKGYGKEVEGGTTYYELESMDGSVKRDLLYAADGKLVEIEESVAEKDLPEAVAKAFAAESPKARAAKIEKTTNGGKVTYEFAMGQGKSELVIDPSGNIVEHSTAVKAKMTHQGNEKKD